MTHKLMITPPAPIIPNPIRRQTGFESPIGWWKVDTEGDCEGRSTRQLGEHFGHVAEIALHLADQAGYTIQFHPILNRAPCKRVMLQAARNRVWISLDIQSNTWGMDHETRAKWIGNWMDCDQVVAKPTNGHAHYYAGTFLELKG